MSQKKILVKRRIVFHSVAISEISCYNFFYQKLREMNVIVTKLHCTLCGFHMTVNFWFSHTVVFEVLFSQAKWMKITLELKKIVKGKKEEDTEIFCIKIYAQCGYYGKSISHFFDKNFLKAKFY